MKRTLLILATLVVAGLFGSAHAASAASLHRFIPEGLSHYEPAAFGQVMSRAGVDSGVGHFMAHETGESTFVASHYVAWGYRTGAPGTVNAGVDNYGNFVPTADTSECNVHSLMFVIKNKRTGQTVLFCVACGNGRPHITRPVPYHKFTKNTFVHINKTFKKKFTYVCLPSEQSVSVVVTTWVHGVIRAKTWAIAQNLIQIKTNIGYSISINQTVKFSCGGIPATAINLNKLWQDSSSKDITASQNGRAVSVLVAVYKKVNGAWVQVGNTYHTTIKTGTTTVLALPSVTAGEAVQACEQDFDSNAEVLVDPSGTTSDKPCLTSVVKNPKKPVNFTFTNRAKPPAPKPTPPVTPPTPPASPPPPAPKSTTGAPPSSTGGTDSNGNPDGTVPSNGLPPTGQGGDTPQPGGGELPDPQ